MTESLTKHERQGAQVAVFAQFRIAPYPPEWLVATFDGEQWRVPDTQCGGDYPLDLSEVEMVVPLPSPETKA